MPPSPTPLYLRWLWWRHTWTFQAAHKPLCPRFHQDVLRVGPLRLCRSCTALYGSFALGVVAAPLYWTLLDTRIGLVVTALLLAIVVVSAPPVYRHASRPLRDVCGAAWGSWALSAWCCLPRPPGPGELSISRASPGPGASTNASATNERKNVTSAQDALNAGAGPSVRDTKRRPHGSVPTKNAPPTGWSGAMWRTGILGNWERRRLACLACEACKAFRATSLHGSRRAACAPNHQCSLLLHDAGGFSAMVL